MCNRESSVVPSFLYLSFHLFVLVESLNFYIVPLLKLFIT
jgi:hypothetical protein